MLSKSKNLTIGLTAVFSMLLFVLVLILQEQIVNYMYPIVLGKSRISMIAEPGISRTMNVYYYGYSPKKLLVSIYDSELQKIIVSLLRKSQFYDNMSSIKLFRHISYNDDIGVSCSIVITGQYFCYKSARYKNDSLNVLLNALCEFLARKFDINPENVTDSMQSDVAKIEESFHVALDAENSFVFTIKAIRFKNAVIILQVS